MSRFEPFREDPRRGAVAPAAADATPRPSAEPPSGQAVRILVVEDEPGQRCILAEILEAAGYGVDAAGGVAEARDRLDEGGVDLVLTDLRMPDGSGIELLEEIKRSAPDVEVILMTAFSSVETAVDAMRKGAHHYLPKPFDKEDLLRVVGQIAGRVRLRHENHQLRRLVGGRYGFEGMLGASRSMREVFSTLEKLRSSRATVLIRGESGTGKELVARAIHASGGRADAPFVAINCAAIPETLIESELFGHERGAFTGATAAKVGRFEEAGEGTLFLDEIGSMRHDLQAKLLRVIQEREFQRVGGKRMLRFRGRIVAATSQDLEALMRENRFREDLYFRLNVVPVEIPPLRSRQGDLPLLARHFVERFAAELGRETPVLAPEVLDMFEAYDWPGNVRELENVVQRMVILADASESTLGPDLVPAAVREDYRLQGGGSRPNGREPTCAGELGAPGGRDREASHIETVAPGGDPTAAPAGPGEFRLPREGVVLADLEAELIRQALERARGRLEPAARLLGISYKTLQYRIRKHGLQEYQR